MSVIFTKKQFCHQCNKNELNFIDRGVNIVGERNLFVIIYLGKRKGSYLSDIDRAFGFFEQK